MLQGASNAGDHFATLRLLRLALQQDQLKPSTLPESWKVFEEMKAQRKPSAFRLQAMMDEANGNPAKAEESYDFMAKYAGTRTSADDTYLQQALAGPDGKSINLWIARANFLLHRGDLTGATDCLERGAFEQKDATAHYLRAVVELGEKGHTNKWLYHTCKAAESHHAEAAHLLGIYYGCDPGVIDATALDPDLIGEWDQSEPAMWLHLSFRVTIMRQELSRLWFEKAAKLGSVRSLLGLARAYWTCDGEGGRTTALAALEEFLRYPSASKYWPQTYKVAKELLPLWKGAVV